MQQFYQHHLYSWSLSMPHYVTRSLIDSDVQNCLLGSTSLMMEAVRISETSVDKYCTPQYIPEDNSEHHTRHRENLKSHID
jgi:hypothetical protein